MYLQYPPKTTGVYSYIEARGGKYPFTVFFGLQAYIKHYLLTPITVEDIDEAEALWALHGEPFNRAGWEYILSKHAGFLPVRINAVPEGTVVPYKNVLCTVEVRLVCHRVSPPLLPILTRPPLLTVCRTRTRSASG